MKHGLANGAASPQPPQLTWCDPPAPRGIDLGEGELCLQLLAERSPDRRPCELPQLAWRAPDDYHGRRATRSAARRHQARPTLAVGLRGGAGGAPVHGGGASSPPPLHAPSTGIPALSQRPSAAARLSGDGGTAPRPILRPLPADSAPVSKTFQGSNEGPSDHACGHLVVAPCGRPVASQDGGHANLALGW
mgnify:CR=1 FL=1